MSETGAEQAYVNVLYARLDALREEAAAGVARGDVTGVWRAELSRLDSLADGLCFGRLDLADGRRVYVGRLGIFEGDDALLVDWRAPAAQRFYTATAAAPDGVVRRRRITTRGRTVVAVDDELLDADAPADGLVGEAALLAAVIADRSGPPVSGLTSTEAPATKEPGVSARRREDTGLRPAERRAERGNQTQPGRMRDIVSTLQAEQDRIIRDDHRGVLVVQGGPGTGKTAVALHRVAYLLYTHEHLRTRGVLVVGPSHVFLDYIGQVLPGLGEDRVVTATISDLVPGAEVSRVDPAEVAARKGHATMASRIADAVRVSVHIPDEPVEFEFEQQVLTLDPTVCRWAVRKARQAGLPHNQARLVFQREIVRTLTQRLVDLMESVVFTETGEALDGGSADGRLSEADLRALAAAGVVLDANDGDGPRTMLDETDKAGLRDALSADAGVAAALDAMWPPLTPEEVVSGLLADQDRVRVAEGRTSVTGHQDWSAEDVPLLDEAAALVGVSVPTYGHVVVDEAQELSEMDWRMILRRCPTRSMTIVGDLAQTGTSAGATSWQRVLRQDSADRLAQLTVNYRTPAEIMAVAAELLATYHPDLRPPRSVRHSGEAPWRLRTDDLAATLAELAAAHSDGQLAIIAPAGWVDRLAAELSLPAPPDLTGKVVLLTPAQAKGLEFDAVLIADPAGILAAPLGHNDLYVAMTRATRRLGVVHTGPPPEELSRLTVR